MDAINSALVSSMAPIEDFDEYTAKRVFPAAFRIARASVAVYIAIGVTDFFLIADTADYLSTMPYRLAALAALALMVLALGREMPAGRRVGWTFAFGLVAEIVMVYYNLFLLNQPGVVVFIVMYFLFGVLIVAPSVAMRQYILVAVGTTVHLTVQLGLKHVETETALQVASFVLLSLGFLGQAVYTQRKAARELWRLAAENYRHSTIDALSQVLNRGTWYARTSQVLDCKRGEPGRACAFIMLDIDNFKAINDTWGHESGDLVIQQVAEALTAEVREGDIVGRLGGEEFGVLLAGTEAMQARNVAERIRARIERLQIITEKQTIHVTASLGVCKSLSGKQPLDQLVRMGDESFYRAKHGGRNRVDECNLD